MQFKVLQAVIITDHLHIQAQVHDTSQNEGPGAVTVALDLHLIHIHFQHYEAVVPQIQPQCPPFASISDGNYKHAAMQHAKQTGMLHPGIHDRVPANVRKATPVEVYITAAWFPLMALTYSVATETAPRLR